jgi:hypothetical protein
MAQLNKEQVLSAKDNETVLVDVPEWNDQLTQEQRDAGEVAQVLISRMSGDAKDRWEASVVGKNGGPNFDHMRAKLVASVVVDEKGNLLFDEKDVIKLGKKSSKALDRIIEASEKLNRMSSDDYEKLAKNS